ncbi:hypothetical protein LPJ58_006564, partial [Coemansia sp. RSA 1591]
MPTFQPSYQSSYQPVVLPQLPPLSLHLPPLPSYQPSLQPTFQLSYQSSYQPSYQPSFQPSFQSSFQPSYQPSLQPSLQPSYQPGVLPQLPPSFQQAPPPVQLEQQPWMQVVQQALLQYPQAPPSFQQPPAQQEQPVAKNTKKRRPAKPQQKADCQYIDELSQATLQNMAGRCVLIDPGRRDLLFAMHEDSTVEDKQLYRYTRNQQRKETRVTRFKRILEKVKPADIAEAERSLGAGSCVKPDLKLFKEYLKARAQVADKLTCFYNETYTVHPTSTHKIHKRKPKAEVRAYPLHRKLRLSAYVNQKQADQRLINKLRKEFGPNAVIVIGDWSAPMNRFHEPIRGKSWRELLKRGGFEVYLIK